ncbi:hypothetical protein ABB37_08992 [Leptomonas pyrrhocoris]|uniref:Uncharacterized protein n=1 Tax=Leptomonas pyrrhocoris TaxID=157538 RepID=A0A0M9FRV5_LEPPY|nr:hypothetical protein ABB37_08992 [Leptomonas pyrrhocoris]KPA74659.1 hypothetical protein ABB37_08992 [Leptomonas pyrrhocoris]|eukprot:XP_015653098.1 hypothetical protein ABB37_08992 [Leptomonas pyrrhocoris]
MMGTSDSSVLTSVVSDVTAIISDIDGTLAHYAKTLVKLGYERLESEPPYWRQDDKRNEDEIDRLLWECYPQSYRNERFSSIPYQYWRHKESCHVVKTYELYNLSLTGAIISENTVLLMELLQCKSLLYWGLEVSTLHMQSSNATARKPVVCCLITGARTSTFIRRRHGGSLPQTVFESCEGGSKLWDRLVNTSEWFKDETKELPDNAKTGNKLPFYPPDSNDVPMDVEWTNNFSGVTGFHADRSGEENQRLSEGKTTIWSLEAELIEAGFATDHDHYDTSFLIDIRNSPCVRSSPSYEPSTATQFPMLFDDTEEAEKYVMAKFRETYNDLFDVELFMNLGKGQVNARGGGKRGVMLHVLEKAALMDCEANGRSEANEKRFSVEHTVALFDDENDLQFAELCGAGILPSVAHEEVLSHKQWRCDPRERRWFRPPVEGPLGSEWALKQIVLFKRQGAVS